MSLGKNKERKWGRYVVRALVFTLLFLVAFITWFNRAPAREIPQEPSLIVSPANGKVIAILREDDAVFDFLKKGIPNEMYVPKILPPYKAIIIEMNIWNVHVQRAPVGGKVIEKQYVPGKFRNAVFSSGKEYLAMENEKMIHVFERKEDGERVGVIQVAGILARRIQSFVHPGDEIEKGEIFGRILLGSQVILILPLDADVLVHRGDTLIDGESVVALLPQK